MASAENINKRLIELINYEGSLAVSLTGEWGVGKTHFWNNFYRQYHTDLRFKHYSYVSLFGIESIEDLKFQLYAKAFSTTKNKDNLSFIKRHANKIMDLSTNLFGNKTSLTLTKELLVSIATNTFSDTLICLDDIERLSRHIDLKDLLGLVNFLKNERECTIVILLNEKQAHETFNAYKEKVFDESLILDDNLSIIETIITDKELFPTYKKFYETISLKNLRFYQNVQRTYYDIINNITHELSLSSKQNIVESLLIIRLVLDMPDFFEETPDIDFFIEYFYGEKTGTFWLHNEKFSDAKKQLDYQKYLNINNVIVKFNDKFSIDKWGVVTIQYLRDLEINIKDINELITNDLINERNIQSRIEHDKLMDELYSLNPEPNFSQRLHDTTINRIGYTEIINLSFVCNILRDNGYSNLEKNLENRVKEYISNIINSGNNLKIEDWYFREKDKRFSRFIEQEIKRYYSHRKLENHIQDLMLRVYKGFILDKADENTLKKLNKDTLRKILWIEHKEIRYRRKYIESIINNEIIKNKHEVTQWIKELLEEKIQKNPESKAMISYLLQDIVNNEK